MDLQSNEVDVRHNGSLPINSNQMEWVGYFLFVPLECFEGCNYVVPSKHSTNTVV